MPNNNEQPQSHLNEAIRSLRLRHLLTIILPFAPNVMTIDCHEHLVRWIAERTGWVVAIDRSLERLGIGSTVCLRDSPGVEFWVVGFTDEGEVMLRDHRGTSWHPPAKVECVRRFEPDNVDLFRGTLAEYIDSPDAWDLRLGFDLVIDDGVLARATDPALELKCMKEWAPWVLAAAGEEKKKAFLGLFEKVVVCEDDGDTVIVLGR